MYGIVLTGAVCPRCDTNCRDSFRKLLLLVSMAVLLNGDAYLTIPILLNTSSNTIVHNVRHRHIRARVWIMIISIILYRLIVYYVLSAVCVFNAKFNAFEITSTCPFVNNLQQLLIVQLFRSFRVRFNCVCVYLLSFVMHAVFCF